MASSLSQLLLNQSRATSIATRKALLVLDLQNDFVQEGGKLPVTLGDGFQKHLADLAITFRQASSEVVWVRTEFEFPQPINEGAGNGPIIIHADSVTANGKTSESDEDSEEEMLLSALEGKRASWGTRPSAARMAAAIRRSSSRSSNHQPTSSRDAFLSKAEGLNTCCLPDTYGSRLCLLAQQALDPSKDLQIVKTTYSAFDSESLRLLMFLRSRLVTELYLCGSLTNISVYATASDAVRHGFEVYVIDDCLGHRNVSAHEEALSRMVDVMGVLKISAEESLVQLSGGVTSGSDSFLTSPPLSNSTSITGNRVAHGHVHSTGLPHIVTSSKFAISPASQSVTLARSSSGTSAEHHDLHRRLSREMRKRSAASLAPIVPILVEECSEEIPTLEDYGSEAKVDVSDGNTSALLLGATPIEDDSKKIQKQEDIASKELIDNLSNSPMTAALVNATLAEPEEAIQEYNQETELLQPELPSMPHENGGSIATPTTPLIPDDIETANSESSTLVNVRDINSTDAYDQKIPSQLSLSNLATTTSANISDVTRPHAIEEATLEQQCQSEFMSTVSPIQVEEQISNTTHESAPLLLNNPDSQDVLDRSTQNSPQTTEKLCKLPTRSKAAPHPVFGANDHIGEGDSRIIYDAITSMKPDIFITLKNEVHWQKMSHAQGEVPRLVCAQGVMDPINGCIPVYRHPSDHSLPLLHFSRTVSIIKDQVQNIVGHCMNHVLIQLYRSGQDNISEHSDKTLDIVRGSSIVNVSLGAQRTMRLRTKKSATLQSGAIETSRKTQLVPMPHGSVFVLGQRTNMAWLHGINADKRPAFERSAEELAFCGERISLTFRHIGTFLDADSKLVWGQGACCKRKIEARAVINGDPAATQKLINAFGYENQQTKFDWDEVYGSGFDVLHFTHYPTQERPLLFNSGNPIHDRQIELYLEELGVSYHTSGVSREDAGHAYSPTLCFRDTDILKTQVCGVGPTLSYLNQTYKHPVEETPKPVLAEALRLMWEYNFSFNSFSDHEQEAAKVLTTMEEALAEDGRREYAAGTHFSMADAFFWPLVDEAFGGSPGPPGDGDGDDDTGAGSGPGVPASAFPLTKAYWKRILGRQRQRRGRDGNGKGSSVEASEFVST